MRKDAAKGSKSSNKASAKPDSTAVAENSQTEATGGDSRPESPKSMFSIPRIIMRGVFIAIALYLVRNKLGDRPLTLVSVSMETEKSTFDVTCSDDYETQFRGCLPVHCKRVVMDGLFTTEEVQELRSIADKGMALGGSAGGPTILDLHSGAVSKGDKFINVYKAAETAGVSPLFTDADYMLYKSIKDIIKHHITVEFDINPSSLYLTKPTFFSRMTSLPAKTIHDQYWHPHVDKVTYGSFFYTSLIYLSDYGQDFHGGRFVFADSNGNKTVEPRSGRLSFFTSGSENTHYVEKVRDGTRFALTIAFTCDKKYAIDDPQPQ